VATAYINTDPFVESHALIGLDTRSFYARLTATSEVVLTENREKADFQIDARYPALLPETLHRAINARSNLRSASGDLVVEWLNAPEVPKEELLSPHEDRALTDCAALIAIEGVLRARVNAEWIQAGVHIIAPDQTIIDALVSLEPGVTIWPGVILRGNTRVGSHSEIQSGCWVEDSTIGAHVLLKPHSVCANAVIADHCNLGPMAHLRPGTILKSNVKVGNFVEIKKSVLESGAKASHLSYIGDTNVGEEANIGAGTITCNYDGYGKHRTEIGARAFIGSNTSLVAPVSVGEGAIIGAGSAISRDIPKDALAVERSSMRLLEGKAPSLHKRNRIRAGK
jgi:bifunctional UDP-N-acetylglucosamine pyrophosphorylase / glucosamine-1-phosphate N-acetyltransferase